MWCRSPRAAARTGRTSSRCCVTCNRRKGGRTPAEAGMHLLRAAEAARLGAGDPHHRRPPQRPRKLARLPLLERRARRHLACFRRASLPFDPRLRDRRRPHHALEGTDFPVDRAAAARRSAIGERRGARRARVADAARRHRARRDRRRRPRRRCASTACRRTGVSSSIARAVRDRPAPGGQPGLRPRRQPVRHLQRHARPAGAGLDLPRAPERHARDRSRPASSTRRRWRSIPTAGCTCRAGSRARSTASTPMARRSRSPRDLGVACGLAFARRRHAVCRRSIGHDLPGRRDGQRRRRSRRCRPSVAAFHLAVGPDGALYVTGADAVAVRRVYRIDRRRDGRRSRRSGSAGRRGSRSIAAASLFVVEALAGASGLYRVPRHGRRPSWCSPGPGLVGVAFDPARRRWSSASNETRAIVLDALGPSTCSACTSSWLRPRRIAATCRNSSSASRSRTLVDDTEAHALKRVARRRRSDHAGDRRRDRRRHLRRDRHGGGRSDRARTAR